MACDPPGFDYPTITGYSIKSRVYRADIGLVYTIQWRASGSQTWNIITDNGSESFVLPSLTNNTVYELRSQRECSATRKSDFSSVVSYTTACPSASFSNLFLYSQNEVCWDGSNSIQGTVNYIAQWRKTGTAEWQTSPIVDQPCFIVPNPTNHDYDFRVKTLCKDGSESDYTSIQKATLYACGFSDAAQATTYMSCIGSTGVGIEFSGCNNPHVHYELRWRKADTDCWQSATVTDSLSKYD